MRLRHTTPLKLAREQAGLTATELAEEIGSTVSAVSYMEHGRRGVSDEMCERLAGPLELEPDEVRDLVETTRVVYHLALLERSEYLEEALQFNPKLFRRVTKKLVDAIKENRLAA